jgi:hypothetical protein
MFIHWVLSQIPSNNFKRSKNLSASGSAYDGFGVSTTDISWMNNPDRAILRAVITLHKVQHSINYISIPREPGEENYLQLVSVEPIEHWKRPSEGITLLLHAIRNEDLELVELLLNSGAKMAKQREFKFNRPGKNLDDEFIYTESARNVALSTGNRKIIDLLGAKLKENALSRRPQYKQKRSQNFDEEVTSKIARLKIDDDGSGTKSYRQGHDS